MEEKMIRLTLKNEKSKGNTTITTEENAIIRFNGSTTLSQVIRFEKQAKAIYKKSIKALKYDKYRTRVTLSITHWNGESGENLVHSNWFTSDSYDTPSDDHITLYAHKDNDIMVEDFVVLKANILDSISVVDYH